MDITEKKIEFECNECDWQGLQCELIEEIDDNMKVHFCHVCKSENLYEF